MDKWLIRTKKDDAPVNKSDKPIEIESTSARKLQEQSITESALLTSPQSAPSTTAQTQQDETASPTKKKRRMSSKSPAAETLEFDPDDSQTSDETDSTEEEEINTSASRASTSKRQKRKSKKKSLDGKKSTRKKKTYKQGFSERWLLHPEFKTWLTKAPDDQNKAFCSICQKRLTGSFTHLTRHGKGDFHLNNLKAKQTTPDIQQSLLGKRTSEKQLVSDGELKLVMFCAEHNLPFRLMEHLPKLVSSVCPDSKIAQSLSCGRTKTTNIVKNIFAQQSTEEISSRVSNLYYSILIDETTDVGTVKCLAVVIRYNDPRLGKTRDQFLGLLEVEKATAVNLYNKVIELLDSSKIDKKFLIGFGSDNASVMMGPTGGVQAYLKNDLPHLFILGCICHSFNLCASAACLCLPRTIEDLTRNIYSYFAFSANRIKELKEFQEFIHTQPHKILRLCQTRWLSIQAVANRILEQWNALTLYFTTASVEDHLHSAGEILHQLRNPVNKLYFCFLSYILDIINKMNLQFQSETPQITRLLPTISTQFTVILRNFMTNQYVSDTALHLINPKNPRYYRPLEEIYIGTKCEKILTDCKQDPARNIPADQLRHFYNCILAFYSQLSLEIKKRFPFGNAVMQNITIFDPEIALSGNVRSLLQLANRFPNIISEEEVEDLNTEWNMLYDSRKLFQNPDVSTDLEEFWKKVSNVKAASGGLMFPLLSKLSQAMLSLPHSSAAVERIFSHLNIIKSKLRNRLLTSTCHSLLLTKELLKSQNKVCYNWQPSTSKTNVSLVRESENDAEEDDFFHLIQSCNF